MTSDQIPPVSASENDHATFITEALLRETDRGCVNLGVTVLCNDLERLLRASFRNDDRNVQSVINPLFEEYGPLETFFARIQLAFAMKLISKSVQLRLFMVRNIQYNFAQEMGSTDLDDPRYDHPLDVLNWLGEDTKENATPPGRECKRFANRIAFATAVARLSEAIKHEMAKVKDIPEPTHEFWTMDEILAQEG